MTGKFASEPGLLPPLLSAWPENPLASGVLGGSGRNRGRQVADAHQIVGGGGEGEHPAYPLHSSVPGFPEIAHGLDPAEDFLHPFAQALADGVARVAGSAAVNGRGTPG